jgi:chromosome segregation ATPase
LQLSLSETRDKVQACEVELRRQQRLLREEEKRSDDRQAQLVDMHDKLTKCQQHAKALEHELFMGRERVRQLEARCLEVQARCDLAEAKLHEAAQDNKSSLAQLSSVPRSAKALEDTAKHGTRRVTPEVRPSVETQSRGTSPTPPQSVQQEGGDPTASNSDAKGARRTPSADAEAIALERATGNTKDLNKDLKSLKDKLANKQREMTDELERAQSRAAASEAMRKQSLQELEHALADVQVWRSRFEVSEAALLALQGELAEERTQAEEARGELTKAIEDKRVLKSVQDGLRRELASTQTELAQMRGVEQDLEEARGELSAQQGLIGHLQEENAQAKGLVADLNTARSQLKQQALERAESEAVAKQLQAKARELEEEVRARVTELQSMAEERERDREAQARLEEDMDVLRSEVNTKVCARVYQSLLACWTVLLASSRAPAVRGERGTKTRNE